MPTRISQDGYLVPSLATAIQKCRQESAVVDLVAVVVDATVAPAPVPRPILWLGDDSLSEHERVAVSVQGWRGSSSHARIADIVRLNRVKLVSSDKYAATTIAHFSTDIRDPESAVVPLGHIDEDNAFHEYEPRTDIPLNAGLTHSSCIDRLVVWRSGRVSGLRPLSSPPHPPPCRFVPLEQLPAAEGAAMLHTRACVLQVERRVAEGPPPRSGKRPRRRAGAGSDGLAMVTTFALLRDDPGFAIPFVDARNTWTQLLERAQSRAQWVRFYYVQTGNHGEEVVLLPTKDTRLDIDDDERNNTSVPPMNAESQFLLLLTQQVASQGDESVQPQVLTASLESLSVCVTDDRGETTSLTVGVHSDEHDYNKFCYRLVEALNGSQIGNQYLAPSGFLTLRRTDDGAGPSLLDVEVSGHSSVLWCLLGAYRPAPTGASMPLDSSISCELLRSIIDRRVPLQWSLEAEGAAEEGPAAARRHAVGVEYAGEL